MVNKSLKKGTTLIEVLVASLIIVISIGALLMSYIPRREIIEASKQNTIVQSLFEREFEKVRKLTTEDDLKGYLYRTYTSETDNEPYCVTRPLFISIDGTEYSLYYELYHGKPYKLVSLGQYVDNFLKPDCGTDGKLFGAKVIQVNAFVTWKSKSGYIETKNVIFRGQDAVNI